MECFKEAVRKLYLAGYSQRTVIRMVKDIYESLKLEGRI